MTRQHLPYQHEGKNLETLVTEARETPAAKGKA